MPDFKFKYTPNITHEDIPGMKAMALHARTKFGDSFKNAWEGTLQVYGATKTMILESGIDLEKEPIRLNELIEYIINLK